MEVIKLKNGDRIRAEKVVEIMLKDKTRDVWDLAFRFYDCILQRDDTVLYRDVASISDGLPIIN